MKVCLIGEYPDKIDEAQRVTAFQFARELSKYHQVMTLDVWQFRRPSFWRKLRGFSPDIIHYIPGMSLNTLIFMRAVSFYCRRAVTVVSAMRPYISPLSAWLVPLLKPDLILTQSQETETKLESLGGSTRFLPGGVDVDKFTPASPKSKQRLRQKYGIDNQSFLVLHVGSIKPGRGVRLLGKLQNNNGIQAVVVGPTSVGIHERTRQQLKDSGCLVWTEHFQNINEIYNLADCYVYPVVALKDNLGRDAADSVEMPLSVLEAMACNLPVITTRFGALPRVFSQGNGLIFAEPDEFAGSIEKVRANKLVIETRNKVLPFSWDNITRNLAGIYQRLLEDRAKRKGGRFICFTGMDGAGKTTLARALQTSMKRSGIQGRYVHSRLKPFITRPAMLAGLALFLRGKKRHRSYGEYATRKKRLFQNRLLARAYRYFLFFDYFWQVLLKIRIPLLRGRNIICDRYVYDTVVLDLAVDLNYSRGETARAIRSWLRFLPRPDLVFLMDAPEELVFARKDDIPSLEYLKEVRTRFLKLAKDHGMPVLDSSKPVAKLEEIAADKMKESLFFNIRSKAAADTGSGQ